MRQHTLVSSCSPSAVLWVFLVPVWLWASGWLSPPRAEAQTTKNITLTWGWPGTAAEQLQGFVLEFRCGTTTAWADAQPLYPAPARSGTFPQTLNTKCDYQLRAYNQGGRSAPTNIVSVSTWAAPTAPTNLTEQASTALNEAYDALAVLKSKATAKGNPRLIRNVDSAQQKTEDAIALSVTVEGQVGP